MTWTVKDHSADNGAPQGFGSPAAYSVLDVHHVVYQGYALGQGGDRRIHELYWAPGGGGWKLNELTAAAGGPPVLQASAPSAYGFVNTQHVLYEGNGAMADQRVHELYWTAGGGWGHNDLTSAAPGAPAALGVAKGFAAAWEPPNGSDIPTADTQNVVYRDHNSHITALTWKDGKWSAVDLTVLAGGTLTPFDPGGYAFSPTRTKQVLYVGDDSFVGVELAGHVHELLCDANGNWRDFDLHQITGALGEPPPLAVSEATGYAFVNQQTKHVNFVGLDGHIHEFWWGFGTGWQHATLTGQSMSGGPAPDPVVWPVAGYVSEPAMTQHIVYVGQGGAVHELMWDAQQGWQHRDLTDSPTRAPLAFSGTRPSAYIYQPDRSQHVFYFDIDRHLVELWQDG